MNATVTLDKRVRPGLQKEHGVWVFRSGKPVNVGIPDLIDEELEPHAGLDRPYICSSPGI